MRTLAIDLGTRRIGLAMSDEGGRYATPSEVLTVTDPLHAIAPIVALIAKESVQRIVIGLPLNMDDGSLSAQARQVIEWTKHLKDQIKGAVPFSSKAGNPELKGTAPFIFVDERLSSFAAEQQLIDRKRSGEKLTRKRKKEQLDAIAAASFLQDFLDGKLLAIDVEQ